MEKDNFRSNYTGLCHGILNTFVGNTFLELPPSSFKNDGAGKSGDTEKKRGDPEKVRNNTSETRSREISKLNFHSSEKIRWFPACNKPEETELLCGIQTFKDGWAFERASRKRQFSLQTGPRECLFFSTSSEGHSKIRKVSIREDVVPFFLPVLWALFSPTDLYRAYESPNINSQEVEYIDNSHSGRHSVNCTFTKRNGTCKG